jgi:virulence-associated protein VapD
MFRFNHHHQGACYLSSAEVTVAKTIRIINSNTSLCSIWWCVRIYYQVLVGICLCHRLA